MLAVSFELLIILILVGANGFLAMAEMAIVSARKTRLRKAAEDGERGAKIALTLTEGNNQFLAAIQVGITTIGVFAGAYSGAKISAHLAAFFDQVLPTLQPYSAGLSLAIVVLGITVMSLIFGELVPKKIALNNPERIASFSAPLIQLLGYTAKPLVLFLNNISNFVLKFLGAHRRANEDITEEEMKLLIEEGSEAGVFEKHEETIMKRVFRLDDMTVDDLMTPRTRVVGIDIHEPLLENIQHIIQHNHSYFPVFDHSMDKPIGLVSVKKLFALCAKNQLTDLRATMDEPLYFPDSLNASVALAKFRELGRHIALVLDEYGGFAGLLSISDILEAIVGEIPDSQTVKRDEFVKRDDGSFLVDGLMDFTEFLEAMKLDEEFAGKDDDDFQTVAGFILTRLKRIPRVGDSFSEKGYRFEVVDMDGRRIDKILVAKKPPKIKPTIQA